MGAGEKVERGEERRSHRREKVEQGEKREKEGKVGGQRKCGTVERASGDRRERMLGREREQEKVGHGKRDGGAGAERERVAQ